jgi:hypothetical protein
VSTFARSFLFGMLVVASFAGRALAEDAKTVKVFILAGQSNMEGKANNSLLEHQATDAKTKELFGHLRKGDEWIVRDDVFIKFLDRSGGLTIGYGSPNKTGAELEFGNAMGNHFDEPVLLIKAAWGGHSLYQKFRSPSSGLPDDATLQLELNKSQERVMKNNEKRKRTDPMPTMEEIKSVYGSSYRNMLTEVDKKLEVAGFVWFQGFNDMFGDFAPGEYEANMKRFINDVRKDLKSPKLPFVIGALGQNGSNPAKGGMVTVANAQLAMNDVPEFKGNVKTIRTDVLADKEAERVFPGWQKHFEEWKLVGSDRPYHYLGSAIWFNRIGEGFGKTMLELQAKRD